MYLQKKKKLEEGTITFFLFQSFATCNPRYPRLKIWDVADVN